MNEMKPTEFHEINRKLDKINRGLYGEDENNQTGLIARVSALEELAEKLNNAKWYALGALGLVVAIWGIIQAVIETYHTVKGG